MRPLQERAGALSQSIRQGRDKIVVGPIHQAVLVAVTKRVAHPHPDVDVGVDDGSTLDRPVRHGCRLHSAKVLYGSDARSDEFEGRIQRVQIGIHGLVPNLMRQPKLERKIRAAELDRGQPNVVVAVDHSRNDEIVGATDHLNVRVACRQLFKGANRLNTSSALKNRSVIQSIDRTLIDCFQQDVLAPYKGLTSRLKVRCLRCVHHRGPSPLIMKARRRVPGGGRIALNRLLGGFECAQRSDSSGHCILVGIEPVGTFLDDNIAATCIAAEFWLVDNAWKFARLTVFDSRI